MTVARRGDAPEPRPPRRSGRATVAEIAMAAALREALAKAGPAVCGARKAAQPFELRCERDAGHAGPHVSRRGLVWT